MKTSNCIAIPFHGNETVEALSTEIGGICIEKLVKSRKHAHLGRVRERITSQLMAIGKTILLGPGPSRPYGLPIKMAGKRLHIWDLVFEQVDDLESIVNLREVCVMFNELLERKYVAAILPKVMSNHFSKESITWDGGRKNDWLKTLASLRTLSRASTNTLNDLIDLGMIWKPGTNWFSTNQPFYLVKTEAPILRLGASDMEQRRLERTLKRLQNRSVPEDAFFFKALIFDESLDYRVTADLPSLRKSFETVLSKVGPKILSFLYKTEGRSFETYANLRRWMAFMPNLKDLLVELQGMDSCTTTSRTMIAPFPTCPSLKRYVEGPDGLGFPFLKAILISNPTIQEVLLGYIPSSEWGNMKDVLDKLQITKFHTTCIPDINFFNLRFQWSLQLTTLVLWDPFNESWQEDISSEVLFHFISSFENLVDLMVSTPRIQGTGGYLNLLKLEHVLWEIFSDYKTLEFLTFAENLGSLDLDLTVCPDLRGLKDLMEFLEVWNVPFLFPAMKRIRTRSQNDVPFSTVWTRGSA